MHPGSQSRYGIFESNKTTGELQLSWEKKAKNILSLLGSVSDMIAMKMLLEDNGISQEDMETIRSEFDYTFTVPDMRQLHLEEDLVSCRYKTFGQDFAFGSATAAY